MEEIPGRLSQQQLRLVMKRSCPKSFFFFYRQLPFHCERTAQVNGVSDHEGLAHTDMHLGENTTHIHS